MKKTSAEWIKEFNYEIINPDSWDRKNYDYSFNKEKITMEEFQKTAFIINSYKQKT